MVGRPFRSLKFRLFLLMLLAMAPAVGLMVYSAAEQRAHAVEEAQQSALSVARSIASEHQRWVDSSHNLVRLLSELPVVQSDDAEACHENLLAVLQQNPSYTVFGVVEADGRGFCSTLDRLSGEGALSQDWFHEVLGTGEFTVGDHQIGAVTGRPIIVFAYPVLDAAGEVNRVVFASLDLSWIDVHVAKALMPDESMVTIMDSAGNVIARHPDNSIAGQNLAHVPSFTYALAQREEGVTAGMEGADGERKLYGVVPFGGQPDNPAFRVLVGMPMSSAYAQADSALRWNLSALGLVAMVGLLTSWTVGNRFVFGRVRTLVNTAQRLGIGDFSARTQMPHDNSDFGRVAMAFDQMAASLEAREQEQAEAERQRIELAREQSARAIAEADERRQAVLYAVSKTLLNATSIQEAAPILLQDLASGLGSEAATFWKTEEEARNLSLQASWDTGRPYPVASQRPLPAPSKPSEAEESHTIALSGHETDQCLAAAWRNGLRWAIRIPLETKRGTLGYLEFLNRELPDESEAMLQALTTVGRHIGQFIEEREVDAARAAEEKQLRAVIETSPAGVVVVEAASNKILHINQEWERISGVSRDHLTTTEELASISVREKPDGSPYERDDLPLYRVFRTGEPVLAEQIRYRFQSGREVPTLVSAAPVKDEEGNLFAGVLIVQDITKLQEVERLRNEFLGMVSHEMRTPLAIIKMTAEGAYADGSVPTPDETEEAFQTISDQAERLLRLVSNLRDVAQVEAGAFSVTVEPNHIEPLLLEVRAAIQRTARTQINVETPLRLPMVLMDTERIRQVLENLLHNAVKFSPPDAVVHLSVESGHSHVTVRVRNSGPGIPVEQQSLLFRKFSQLQAKAGVGLGLAISKGIVEAHGGRIWVDSSHTSNETTFGFMLPIAEPSAPAAESSGGPANSARQDTVDDNHRPKRVLIVDDEPLLVRQVTRILERAGYDVTGVTDPNQVLPTVEASPPDLVILDLRLPGTDGFEVFAQLKPVCQAPVLFLSAGAQESDRQRAIAMGAKDYIVKPIAARDLLAHLDAVFGTTEQAALTETSSEA